MSSRRWQKGEGKAGCIFWILVFLIGLLFAWQMIPAKIADMQLKDHMEELAKNNPRKEGNFFRDQILRRAKDLDIPLREDDIHVEKNLRYVRMRVEYTVPLNFIVTTINWKFGHDIKRDIFII